MNGEIRSKEQTYSESLENAKCLIEKTIKEIQLAKEIIKNERPKDAEQLKEISSNLLKIEKEITLDL
ncbi:MAG: hypothetical protein ACOCQD_01890 [archaeon]